MTSQLLMALALMGADPMPMDPNVIRQAAVLITSAQAPYIDQGFVEKDFPSVIFYYNGEFQPMGNNWIEAGRVTLDQKQFVATTVKGKFKPDGNEFAYSIPAEQFLAELREHAKEIDESFYFTNAADNNTNLELFTKGFTKDSPPVRFYMIPRKVVTSDVAQQNATPQYTFPPTSRSLAVEFGHRDKIAEKLKRLKLGMKADPRTAAQEQATQDPNRPSAIGRELFSEHYDYLPFTVSVKYEPPGEPQAPEMLPAHAVVSQRSQTSGLLVLPALGLKEWPALASAQRDLRTEPAEVTTVLRDNKPQQQQDLKPKPLTGFDINAEEFINRVLGEKLSKVSGQTNHSCMINTNNTQKIQASACKRRAENNKQVDYIEIRKATKEHTFKVWDTETNLYVWEVKITPLETLPQNFTTVAPLVSRE